MDEVIVFRKLDRPDLERIVRLELNKLASRMAEQGRKLLFGEDVMAFIIDRGFQPEYGARPLRRSVERWIEDPLAEDLLSGALSGDTSDIRAVVSGDRIVFGSEAGAVK